MTAFLFNFLIFAKYIFVKEHLNKYVENYFKIYLKNYLHLVPHLFMLLWKVYASEITHWVVFLLPSPICGDAPLIFVSGNNLLRFELKSTHYQN